MPSHNRKIKPMLICSIGMAFVLFQFFLQLSSGVMISTLMQEMSLSALSTSILSSAFYYVYTLLQIPVGLLFDRYNTRLLISFAVLLCSLGCISFAQSHDFISLVLSRLIIGTGAAFAFIGLSQLLRTYFPPKKFAFLLGLSETFGFLITMIGVISLSFLIKTLGWREVMLCTALLGLAITLLSFRLIPATTLPILTTLSLSKQIRLIVMSKKLWLNGLYVGLCFSVITVFGAMWAIPFIQIKLGCSLKIASVADAMIFGGAAISCPLFGYFANTYAYRWLMIGSSLVTACLFLILLFFCANIIGIALLMFFIGISCGAYMLSYSIANKLSPPGGLSTATGFTNTLAMLSAPIMQLFIGFLLDTQVNNRLALTIEDFQRALLVIPSGLFIACFLAFILPNDI